jgi:hypothetical protein
MYDNVNFDSSFSRDVFVDPSVHLIVQGFHPKKNCFEILSPKAARPVDDVVFDDTFDGVELATKRKISIASLDSTGEVVNRYALATFIEKPDNLFRTFFGFWGDVFTLNKFKLFSRDSKIHIDLISEKEAKEFLLNKDCYFHQRTAENLSKEESLVDDVKAHIVDRETYRECCLEEERRRERKFAEYMKRYDDNPYPYLD